MEFQDGLRAHLAAIDARNIERFAATISRNPDARAIAPDGTATVGYDAIVAAHRAWFASEARWTFDPHIVLMRASETLGFALCDVDYREGASQRRFLLSLLFTYDDGAWKLFYDQNTPA
ncbi:MAG: nuclear transport factor 2 family protein [Candidatus Eremiobacteraeota bacterium]|nr:nuclear transport factor 2 family protein [Candidatus Eremiobacteraeota bacterium]MBC5802244.1 nuclear transport factor 2 family protein [Candidatus Eremiobacteraeota bacterium]MBC5820566.1 nuclear transport factor 2 family protein [Candidatus Eremiobacteraeota bacterium]